MKTQGFFALLAAMTLGLWSFGQDSTETEVPCTGTQGLCVNFDKTTNAIIETECETFQFLFNYIKAGEDNFVLIAIYTDHNDEAEKSMAQERSKRVKTKLIEMGINPDRLSLSLGYHNPPGKNEHHDWPFYPPHFTYEIGVYVHIDY